MCCFVLLVPTPEEYRVPRVSPGVTAPKLFPRALLFLTDHSRKPGTTMIRGSEWQSGVQHLLGLIRVSGLRRGGRGSPCRPWWLSLKLDLRWISCSPGPGAFGLWRVCFPPCLVRPGPAGDCPCRD